jgi:membrane associated rhomboid family serine protease
MIPIRDTVPSRCWPVVTWALIAANAAVFLYEVHLPPEELQRFIELFGLVPARYSHPQWAVLMGFPLDDYWPFVTNLFLHGGWLHVLGNLWTLWIFGDNVEDRMGPGRFLAFYLLCGILANATHFLANPSSTLPTVGASGAIAGVLGAYFVLFPFSRVIALFPVLFFPVFFEVPAVLYLFFWFLSQVLGGTLQGLGPEEVGGVAFWAHAGGFAAGVVLHRLFLPPRGRRPRRCQRDELGLEGAWGWRL